MPDSFELALLGDLAVFEMGQSPPSAYVSETERGLPFLQGNAEFGARFPLPRLHCSRPTKVCQPGDILISVRAPVGALNQADQSYVIGRGLAAVRFTAMPSDLGWHLLGYWARNLQRVAQGTTFEAVSKDDLFRLKVVHPTNPDEQRRIAAILDTVDEAIRQTERLVEKLKAMKAGLLHDLLTRGLDEHGRLRDPVAHPGQFKETGFGKVPKGWEVVSLGEISHVTKLAGFEFTNMVRYVDNGEIIALRALNIKDERLDLNDVQRIRAEISDKLPRSKVYGGDILITYIGAYIGDVLLIEESNKYHLAPNIAKITVQAEILSEFLQWALRGELLRAQIGRYTTTTATPSLTMTQIRGLRVLLPRTVEQREIASLIDAHDARIRAEEAYLAKLRQVKAGLMEDLLTGRVRV
jgi:type I restriction enzyme S subunit